MDMSMGRCPWLAVIVWAWVLWVTWTAQGRGGEGGVHGQGCIGRGGGTPPPNSSRAPSLYPATVSLMASASLNGNCNRQ